MLLRCIFSGLHCYSLSQTLVACRVMQFISFKVETLLNNDVKSLAATNYHNIKWVVLYTGNVCSFYNWIEIWGQWYMYPLLSHISTDHGGWADQRHNEDNGDSHDDQSQLPALNEADDEPSNARRRVLQHDAKLVSYAVSDFVDVTENKSWKVTVLWQNDLHFVLLIHVVIRGYYILNQIHFQAINRFID